MKKSIFLLIGLTLLFFNCKKKSKDDSLLSNNSSIRTKFKDTLVLHSGNNYNDIYATYCSFSDRFFVIQKNATALYDFYNCDIEINNTISKTINLGSESLIEIKASKKDNSFYTLTATNNFPQAPPTLINAYVLNNYIMDSSYHCISKIYDYTFDDSFNINGEIKVNNNSTLNKFDGFGNLMWTKQLDGNYFDGKALETDQNGNVYVLTASKHPLTPKLSSAYSSTLVPYYEFVTDSNSISIYKFDNNGNQEFKKTLLNIKNNTPNSFNPSLSLSKTTITIANTDNLYMLDLDGNLISQNKPIANTCYNYINSIISSPFINHTFINGQVNYLFNSNRLGYLAFYNSTAPVIISQSNNLSYDFLVIDNLENIYVGSALNSTIKKLNNNGTVLYFNSLLDGNYSFGLSKRSTVLDLGNSLYTFSNKIDQIAVYKFDSDGKFN